MHNFERIMKSFALKSRTNKSNLWNLCATVGEGERKYHYEDLDFCFNATSSRTIEKMTMYVNIPVSRFTNFDRNHATSYEDCILRTISPKVNALSVSWQNIDKNPSEKGELATQTSNDHIIRRNGMIYLPDKNVFCFRIMCRFPLTNGTWINIKSGIKMIKSLLQTIYFELNSIDIKSFDLQVDLYSKQQQIRKYLALNNFCAFIADGSILPRENGTSAPMKNAIPFKAPESMRKTISFTDGTSTSGMIIQQGITIITGGGYSGKSTLLDAIEMGIYDHIPGDGREFVITDNTALKIYAEDGRPVHNMDMSPFFKFLPNGTNAREFSTLHASGSISQAANIIEAVCGGSKLLLID